MKVFVTGATGVLGMAATRALLADRHHVVGLARTTAKASQLEQLGAEPAVVSLFDIRGLAVVFAGCDVVCNLATHLPVGTAAIRPGSWRVHDKIRTEGSRAVAAAASQAGVRRLVQESVSLIYADGGDDWITEDGPITVTRALDPAAVAETRAAEFGARGREAVVLRFASLVGDDASTRWMLERAVAGKAVGVGDPTGWAHLVHPSDAGRAVAAALLAPSGVYNVGAEPVRRNEMLRVIGAAVGRDDVGFMPKVVVRVAGERLEPATRSLRVSSARLRTASGWKPIHPAFGTDWLPRVNKKGTADVFGDVLPGSTGDDMAEPGEQRGFSDDDYRRERPPHH